MPVMILRKLIPAEMFVLPVMLWSCGGNSTETTEKELTEEEVDDLVKEVVEDVKTPDSKFINLLYQLEENVAWEAVDSSWSDRRMAWGQEYFEATEPAKLGAALLEFEAVLTWESVAPEW